MHRLLSRSAGRTAASIATIAFAATMLLQLLLALGILPSTMAWGGTQPTLTPSLRLTSLVAIVVLGVFAYVIRRRAGLVGHPPVPRWVKVLAWVITAYLALNTLGNLASPSLAEKALFGSIALILALACLVVALARDTAG
jgi:uncharacterized membrane protein YhdT